jgi:hypothetical protein
MTLLLLKNNCSKSLNAMWIGFNLNAMACSGATNGVSENTAKLTRWQLESSVTISSR